MQNLRAHMRCAPIVLLMLESGCQINIGAVPLVAERDPSPDAAGVRVDEPDPGVTHEDGGVEPEPPDASSMDVDDAGERGPGGPAAPAQHPGCQWASTVSEPEAVLVKTDVRGRPAFDWWRDFACDADAVAGSSHDAGSAAWNCASPSATCPVCVAAEADGGVGVCTEETSPWSCDQGASQVITDLQRGCLLCLNPRVKKQACCEGVRGFDCRPWPYAKSSQRGQLCARHADCESGLVCRTEPALGFGICACPETATPVAQQCTPI